MSEWQPISTAPRDGTDVILWGSCRVKNNPAAYPKDANVGWWDDGAWRTRVDGETCEATHWAPIPVRPKDGIEIISQRGHKIGDMQVNFTVGRIK